MQSVQTHGGRSDRNSDERTRNPRGRGDEGAALIEFAILAPVLFALLFGVIDFGYAFFQQLDVRHGARETARLAAVDFGGGSISALVAEACSRMDENSTTGVDIAVTLSGADVGDEVQVTVRKELDQLTGFFGPFLDGKVLKSVISTRLEQPATYANEPEENPLPGDDCT